MHGPCAGPPPRFLPLVTMTFDCCCFLLLFFLLLLLFFLSFNGSCLIDNMLAPVFLTYSKKVFYNKNEEFGSLSPPPPPGPQVVFLLLVFYLVTLWLLNLRTLLCKLRMQHPCSPPSFPSPDSASLRLTFTFTRLEAFIYCSVTTG